MSKAQDDYTANLIVVPILFVVFVFVFFWTPKGLTETAAKNYKERTGKELFSPRCRKINLETEEKGVYNWYKDKVEERKTYQRTLTPKEQRQERRRKRRVRKYTAGY